MIRPAPDTVKTDPHAEFDVSLLDKLVKIAKNLPYPIKPTCCIDGREYYLIWSTRERMLQNMPVGYTYKAILLRNGGVIYDPVAIDEMDRRLYNAGCAYYESEYI